MSTQQKQRVILSAAMCFTTAFAATPELPAPVSGVITVAAPVGLCREMAGEAYQGDGTKGDAMLCASQTIAELANTIAGQVIEALLPEQAFTLSTPVTERSSYHDWVVMSCAGGTVRLNVAGRPLLASMILVPS